MDEAGQQDNAGAAATTMPPSVLIVDDNHAVARALGILLKNAGFETAVFTTGAAALEYAGGHPISAAVVDIHLPDINGLLLCERLRPNLGPDRPIIVVSGDTSMENLNSLRHAGATYFFSKPLKSSELISQLRQMTA